MSAAGMEWRRRLERMRVPTPAGTAAVFRWRMRSRNAWRDLGWTAVLLAGLLAIAFGLQVWWVQADPYAGDVPNLLTRWMTMELLGGCLLLLPVAAILGAASVPGSAEFEVMQSALMTRLSAVDMVIGRLVSGLWPLLSMTLASCAFWLMAQLGWHFQFGPENGFGPIFLAHGVLLGAILMIGSVAFLLATRRRPRRHWGRGATTGFWWTALCIGGIVLANPIIARQSNPTPLIESVLLINPMAAILTAFDQDFVRAPWLYDLTNAHDYDFRYPCPWWTLAFFLILSLTGICIAAIRLRRAYR